MSTKRRPVKKTQKQLQQQKQRMDSFKKTVKGAYGKVKKAAGY